MQQILWASLKKITCKKYIVKIEKMNIDIMQKCNLLKTEYEHEMIKLITFYKKCDFICACISLKEYFVKHTTKLNKKNSFIYDEQDCILNMLNLGLQTDDKFFKNNSFFEIVNTHSYFIDIIAIARLYVFLCENMTRLEFARRKLVSLNDVAFEPIETEEFNKYYDELSAMGNSNRPEDYSFINKGIAAKLERDNKSINKILQESGKLMSSVFGFNLNTLDKISSFFVKAILDDQNDLENIINDDDSILPVIVLDKSAINEFEKNYMSKNELMKIIETFEIKIDDKLDFTMQIHKLELSCFYRDENSIYFGLIDLCQKFEMFKKFSLSGNHLDLWRHETELERTLTKSQNKLSTYLCYTLADALIHNGYKMHMEVFKFNDIRCEIPTVENKNIRIKGINVTDKYGDYDLIFLDDFNNQIICAEFKYFKPSITYKQLINTDKNKLMKQVIGETDGIYAKKIIARERIVKDNMNFFIKYLNGNQEKEYFVKSIVITARPNLYAFSKEVKEKNVGLSFYTINSFKRLIEQHKV